MSSFATADYSLLAHSAAAAAGCLNRGEENVQVLSSYPSHLVGQICLHLDPEKLIEFVKGANGLTNLCHQWPEQDVQPVIAAIAYHCDKQPMYQNDDKDNFFKLEMLQLLRHFRFSSKLHLGLTALGLGNHINSKSFVWKLMSNDNHGRLKMKCFLDPIPAVYSCLQKHIATKMSLPDTPLELRAVCRRPQSHFVGILRETNVQMEFWTTNSEEKFAAVLAKSGFAYNSGRFQVSLFLLTACLFSIPDFEGDVCQKRHLLLMALQWLALNMARLYVKPELTFHCLHYAKRFFCFPFDATIHLIVMQKVSLHYGDFDAVRNLHKELKSRKISFESIWFRQHWSNVCSSVYLEVENVLLQLVTNRFYHFRCPTGCNDDNVLGTLRRSFKLLEELSQDMLSACALLPLDSHHKQFFELQQIWVEMYTGLLYIFHPFDSMLHVELLVKTRRQLSLHNSMCPSEAVKTVQRLLYAISDNVPLYHLDDALDQFEQLFAVYDRDAGFHCSANTAFSSFSALVVSATHYIMEDSLINQVTEAYRVLTHKRHPRMTLMENFKRVYPDKSFHNDLTDAVEFETMKNAYLDIVKPTDTLIVLDKSRLDSLLIGQLLDNYISLDSEVFCDSLCFGLESAKLQLDF